ncbi:MAG TPA: asparagine synthase-related protein [Candidatus Limnocylindrales bacterium]|nr:asparagine synthase-related protein [Candidatus Limnocylindrales bacterium]
MADLRTADHRDWFAVVPDCAAATVAAQSFLAGSVLRHASGRPWLVGHGEMVTATAGRNRLAVLGPTALTAADLVGLAAGATPATVAELCAAVARAAGSGTLVASLDGTVVARGTASGLRRLHYATIGGVTVVAGEAAPLARAAGGGPDPAAVAEALLVPEVPYPLDPATLWTRVTAVPPDQFVTVAGDGPAVLGRWWWPPEPRLSLMDGADRLRSALRAAVAVRAHAGDLVSADLSGGVDSTALCFLAAERPVRLLTLRAQPLDAANDDPVWAKRAAERLPAAEHLVVDPVSTGTDEPDDDEQPVGGLLTGAVARHHAAVLARHGSRTHLGGYGGDEVLGVSRAYLRDLRAHRPGLVWQHLRAHRALRHWSWPATLRALADDRSLTRLLADTADGLTDWRPWESGPQFGWGYAVRLPPWATSLAADLIRQRLQAVADIAPLARQRAQHRAVTAVWAAAHAARQAARMFQRYGVHLAVPYLDDEVVTAALAVDLAERGTPWRYKALLAEAMRPILPPELHDRRTKGHFAAEGIAGVHRNQARLDELCADLRLADLGLVDPPALRAAIMGPDPSGRVSMALERTIAAELWLRAVARSPSPQSGKGARV